MNANRVNQKYLNRKPNPFKLARLQKQIEELEENGSPECIKFAESLKSSMNDPNEVLYGYLRK
jgi:hypothetical protein